MRLLISGDRNWRNPLLIKKKLQELLNTLTEPLYLMHGKARGADVQSEWAALSLGVPKENISSIPADWDKYGKAAGPIRNGQMLKTFEPDVVWCFHNDIENSKGTKNMRDIALKAGVPVEVFSEHS